MRASRPCGSCAVRPAPWPAAVAAGGAGRTFFGGRSAQQTAAGGCAPRPPMHQPHFGSEPIGGKGKRGSSLREHPGKTKTDVVVAEAGRVPVTVGRAQVLRVVVPRTAPQHARGTAGSSGPCGLSSRMEPPVWNHAAAQVPSVRLAGMRHPADYALAHGGLVNLARGRGA